MIAFIDEHRALHGVEPICRVLPIAPSTYHAHAARRADPGKLPAPRRRSELSYAAPMNEGNAAIVRRAYAVCNSSAGTKQPASVGFGPQNGSQNRERCHDRSRASHLAPSSGNPANRSLSRCLEIAAAKQAQQLSQQAQTAANQRLLRAAANRGLLGRFAMFRLRYLDAAEHFQKAAELVPSEHPQEKGEFLSSEADALYQEGSERGNNAALIKAIAAYRSVSQEWMRERVPLDWAMTQNNLGNALLRLGERESGTARLEEAVAAYQAALEERTHDRVPLDWAMTQFNMGLALTALAERTNSKEQLKEALLCFQKAGPVYEAARMAQMSKAADRMIARLQSTLATKPER